MFVNPCALALREKYVLTTRSSAVALLVVLYISILKSPPHLHGVHGTVSEIPDFIAGGVCVLQGGVKRDPCREVSIAGRGEGALEGADSWDCSKTRDSTKMHAIYEPTFSRLSHFGVAFPTTTIKY